jgi:hypothetical protein
VGEGAGGGGAGDVEVYCVACAMGVEFVVLVSNFGVRCRWCCGGRAGFGLHLLKFWDRRNGKRTVILFRDPNRQSAVFGTGDVDVLGDGNVVGHVVKHSCCDFPVSLLTGVPDISWPGSKDMTAAFRAEMALRPFRLASGWQCGRRARWRREVSCSSR